MTAPKSNLTTKAKNNPTKNVLLQTAIIDIMVINDATFSCTEAFVISFTQVQVKTSFRK